MKHPLPTGFSATRLRKFGSLLLAMFFVVSPVSLACGQDQETRETTGGKQPTPDVDRIRQAPQILSDWQAGSDPLPPILGTDIDGNAFDLRRYAAGHPVVVALTSTSCPLCRKYGPTLADLEKTYTAKGVRFVFIGSIASDSLQQAQQTRDQLGLTGPYVLDRTAKILKTLEADTTTEAFLLDADLKVVYRGAVDDQYGLGYTKPQPTKTYLKDALDQFLEDRPVTVAATSAPGCKILHRDPKATSDLEYYDDIFPIVQNHCVMCHREQGIGPFALQTAEQLAAHAGMIQQVVDDRTMPPWFAAEDPQRPHQWMNRSALSESDRATLLAWLEGDQKIGPRPENLVTRKFPTKWSIGEPDLVVRLPEANAVQASGFMDYIHQKIELNHSQERWVQAVEVRPSSPEVVHHVLVYHVDQNEEEPRIDERSHFLAGYAPGNIGQNYPEGFAKRLPGNSTLLVQMHYTPNGTATTDQTEIAFIFADHPPEHEILVTGIADTNLNIKPHTANHQETATLDVKSEAKALSFFPHMHLRGKSFRFDLIDPDGNSDTILDIPAYDFNWQLEYRLQTPLTVKPGSQIKVTGWFDNSDGNPANPAPDEWVYWGEQTFNEMLIGYVEYYYPNDQTAQPLVAKRQRPTTEQLFRKLDRNEDQYLEASELPRRQDMDGIDTDGDQKVTLEELRRVWERRQR